LRVGDAAAFMDPIFSRAFIWQCSRGSWPRGYP
jgi:hypothetical protein